MGTIVTPRPLTEYHGQTERWISDCVWTFDPRPEANPHTLPFNLYGYQADFVRWLGERFRHQQDGLVEKSRDMGVSWCVLSWLVHHWLVTPGFQALVGSRKEDLVDNGELDSLFGKLAFIVDHLPSDQLPDGWDRKRGRTYMTLSNPANGNAIIGESSNPNFSRQGRYSVIFLDEFAFWEWAASVEKATADATTCRIFVSTPNGTNAFRRLRFSARVPVYTLHWTQHPKKDEIWYKEQQRRRSKDDVASELDISYDKSVRGKVYPMWSDIPTGDFSYRQNLGPLAVSWDFGIGDATTLIWWQFNVETKKWRAVDCYSSSGWPIDFYLPFVTGKVTSDIVGKYSESELALIACHARWAAPVAHRGDPAGNQRNLVNGLSVIDALRKSGIAVECRPQVNTFEARKRLTQRFLEHHVEGVNAATCGPLIDAMINARYPDRGENSQAVSEVTKPIHDWTSHFRTAVEYMAVVEVWHLPEGGLRDFEVESDE